MMKMDRSYTDKLISYTTDAHISGVVFCYGYISADLLYPPELFRGTGAINEAIDATIKHMGKLSIWITRSW